MVEQPENLNTHHLRQFREEMLKRIDAIDQKLEKLDHKVGSVALTLVGVERDKPDGYSRQSWRRG